MKFLNIMKANAEIAALETQLATAQAALEKNKGHIEIITGAAEGFEEENVQLKEKVSRLEAEFAKLTEDNAALTKAASASSGSMQALQIAASQGIPPVDSGASRPPNAPAGASDVNAEYEAVKARGNAAEMEEWFRANKQRIYTARAQGKIPVERFAPKK